MTNKAQRRSWISGTRRRAATAALALVTVLVPGVVATPSAQAEDQDYTILHSFTGSDGRNPLAGLVRDANGNLYGTTFSGGDTSCAPPSGCGTVFKLDTTGTLTVLHAFARTPDGAESKSRLMLDASGNLYGTNTWGGTNHCCGTVFKIDATGKETILHSFTGGADERAPTVGLIRDALSGALYGATFGEALCGHGCGTVFKLDTTGKMTELHTFTDTPDGANPSGELIRDTRGNFYGVTAAGGTYHGGIVFKITGTTNKLTILHNFKVCNTCTDAAGPLGNLVRDANGNFYGTTIGGGAYNFGTVYKVDATGKETVLYSFTGGADGQWPYAGLARDAAGNLYGTTQHGGTYNQGVVFKLDTSGTGTVLHSFAGGTSDGANPVAGLVRDAAGDLYGTTQFGGAYGYGTVFELKP